MLAATASIKLLATPVDKRNADYDAYRGNLVEPIKCKNCVDVFVMKERFTVSVKQVTKIQLVEALQHQFYAVERLVMNTL